MPTSHIATRRPHTRRRHRGGFTLIEAALTTVIVGTGVLAIVAAQQAYHQKNGWAQRAGMAMLLANEIREMTIDRSLRDPRGGSNVGPELDETSAAWPDGDPRLFNDLDDFAGPESDEFIGQTTFAPPISAMGVPLEDMDGWSQVVQVMRVLPDNISADTIGTPLAADTGMMRVSVNVMYEGEAITTLSWVVPEN